MTLERFLFSLGWLALLLVDDGLLVSSLSPGKLAAVPDDGVGVLLVGLGLSVEESALAESGGGGSIVVG